MELMKNNFSFFSLIFFFIFFFIFEVNANEVFNFNVSEIEISDNGKKIKGIKICRQANANWVEKFDKRKSPMGRDYYWLTGEFINQDKGEETDEWALKQGYVSIVPTQFDLTAHHYIQELNNWNLNE